MGNEKLKKSYKIAVLIVAVGTISLFAWTLVKYLQQRPWPPELTVSSQTLNSGDTYAFTWIPAKSGPTPEFYYLEESKDKQFSSPKHYVVQHDSAKSQQQSGSIVAPAVAKSTTTAYCLATRASTSRLRTY